MVFSVDSGVVWGCLFRAIFIILFFIASAYNHKILGVSSHSSSLRQWNSPKTNCDHSKLFQYVAVRDRSNVTERFLLWTVVRQGDVQSKQQLIACLESKLTTNMPDVAHYRNSFQVTHSIRRYLPSPFPPPPQLSPPSLCHPETNHPETRLLSTLRAHLEKSIDVYSKQHLTPNANSIFRSKDPLKISL